MGTVWASMSDEHREFHTFTCTPVWLERHYTGVCDKRIRGHGLFPISRRDDIMSPNLPLFRFLGDERC